MSRKDWEAENYYSKDFHWDELRQEVETNPSFQFHLLPFSNTANQFQDAHHDSEAWNQFHSRHSTGKFFKVILSPLLFNQTCISTSIQCVTIEHFWGQERRYLLKEFPELASCENNSKVLEVGCGNGSTALPILCGREGITLYACDCSNEALERAKEIINAANSVSAKLHFHPFLCDFSTIGFPSWLACNTCSRSFLQDSHLGFSAYPGSNSSNDIKVCNPFCSDETKCCVGGVDFVTLIFTLSAVPLDRMPKAITECFNVLKPGGFLLFRDYGLYDMTMLRFEPEQRKGYREYLRSDGTRSYFFCLNTVRSLTSAAGFVEVELEYCCVRSVNRRNGKIMKRVWVHGKFQKPTN